MHQKTLEDTRRHETEVEDQQLLGGAGQPQHHVIRPPCGILPRPSGVFLHRLLGCISVVREVGLIQGLTVLSQDYKYRP
jgi:hypothetical protein